MMGSSRDAADLPNALRRSSLDSRPSKDMTELLPTKRISVAYQVLSISDVNDNQNRFSVDFIVYYSWYDETLVQHEGDIDWNKVWQPHPKFFDNDLENTTIFSHLTLDEGGRVTLTERYRGTFYERLHLADFPFDRQNLTVNIGSKLPATELRQLILFELSAHAWEIGHLCCLTDSLKTTRERAVSRKSSVWLNGIYSLQNRSVPLYALWRRIMSIHY